MSRSDVIVLSGVLVCAVLGAVVMGIGGDVEVNCHLGLRGECVFTNQASLLPGRKCVTVLVTKETKNDDGPSPFFGDRPEGEVGDNARSARVCSGLVWGEESKSVPVIGFDRNPFHMCQGWGNCSMNVEDAH